MTRWALALLLLVSGGCGCASIPTHHELRATALRLEFADSVCSGTAIARDVLVTAQHCLGRPLRTINGKPVKIVGIGRDSKDLATVRVTGITFTTWARFGPALAQGDRVRWFGNPGGVADVYREGYVVRATQDMVLVDARSYGGDSGSGVFDAQGRLVGVLYGGLILAKDRAKRQVLTDEMAMQLVVIFPMDTP